MRAGVVHAWDMLAAPVRNGCVEGYRTLAQAIVGVFQELREIQFAGPRARQASITALAVAISVGIACAMHLPEVWWAGISGFMSTQATRLASINKAVLRIAGTASGATLGVALTGWLAYDPVACCLALLIISAIGILGVIVSPHGYAWLFFAVTFSLVLLMSLVDPLSASSLAIFRTIEVVVGTVVAIIVAIALAPPGSADTVPEPPGWSDLLGARWPAVMHAVRSGIAVAVLPLVWSAFDLPGLWTMAMTMASVLSIPVLSDHALDDAKKIAEKALQRLLGCLLGGVPALVLLAAPLTSFLPWLGALAAGIWVGAYVQGSTRGVGYVGTQAAIVFIITLVQGEGPPASILPGIDRLVGITLGLTVLLIVTLLVQPADEGAA
jgi:uncharacterized membrane protein YccC